MQSKDLRIGNLVKHLDYHLEVQKIGFTKIWIEDGTISFDEIEPIKLTEEWCIKFGFQKDLENTIYKNINKHCFLCYENKIVTLLEEENNYCLRKIKYVHELQNLYFALTGEELELKSESKT